MLSSASTLSSRKPRTKTLLAIVGLFSVVPIAVVACSNSGVDLFPPSECAKQGQQCSFGCDPNLGCVECAADSDCGAAQPICVAGHCSACGSSSDCGTGQACYPGSHTCAPACTGNGSCQKGDAKLCDPASGACVECIANSDCPAAQPICNELFGTCAQCASNGDCGTAKPICNIGHGGECVECIIDSQCPSGTCVDHQCEVGCKTNGDCGGERPLCRQDGQCVGCLAASDCGVAAPFCSQNGSCVVCQVNADCTNPALPFCSDKGNANSCVQCINDTDCGAGLQCKDTQCVN